MPQNVIVELGWIGCQFLSPGVNLTNILRAAFSYECFLRSFYVIKIWDVIFWQKRFGAKAAHKMLVKLTPGGSMNPIYVV